MVLQLTSDAREQDEFKEHWKAVTDLIADNGMLQLINPLAATTAIKWSFVKIDQKLVEPPNLLTLYSND